MGHLQDQFEKCIKKVINYHANEYNAPKDTVQVQMFLQPVNNTLEAGYKICVGYKPKSEVKAIDLIHPGKNYRIDFTGMSQMVHPFIGKTLFEQAVENNIPPNKMSVFCLLFSKGELEKILLYLYHDENPVKRLDLASMFNDEKIMQ